MIIAFWILFCIFVYSVVVSLLLPPRFHGRLQPWWPWMEARFGRQLGWVSGSMADSQAQNRAVRGFIKSRRVWRGFVQFVVCFLFGLWTLFQTVDGFPERGQFVVWMLALMGMGLSSFRIWARAMEIQERETGVWEFKAPWIVWLDKKVRPIDRIIWWFRVSK